MRLTTKLRKAAQYYLDLQERVVQPDGAFDNAGRWYPEHSCRCCEGIRSPSRQWPYSLLSHCRTIGHIASERGYGPKVLRQAVTRVRLENAL